MGGKNGSGAGMGAGGAGKGGGKGGTPMSADQADQANATRRQNIFTTVGGLSRPGGSPGGPANPRARPSGPSGPPLPRQRPAGAPAATPAAAAPDDPLLGRDPLTGAVLPYGRSVPGGQVPQGVGSVLPEGMSAPALSSVFTSPQMSPGGPPAAGADAEARMKRAKKVSNYFGGGMV